MSTETNQMPDPIESNNNEMMVPETSHETGSIEKYEDKNFVDSTLPVWNYSILYDNDISTFQNGTNYSLYRKMGSKPLTVLDTEGYYFAVWAPNATKIAVIGKFNDWNLESHQLHPRWDKSGIWEGFCAHILV